MVSIYRCPRASCRMFSSFNRAFMALFCPKLNLLHNLQRIRQSSNMSNIATVKSRYRRIKVTNFGVHHTNYVAHRYSLLMESPTDEIWANAPYRHLCRKLPNNLSVHPRTGRILKTGVCKTIWFSKHTFVNFVFLIWKYFSHIVYSR